MRLKTKQELRSSPTHLYAAAIHVGHLDLAEVAVAPVQLLVGVVHCDAVGPVHMGRRHEGGAVAAVKARTLDLGCAAPVGPVDVAVGGGEGDERDAVGCCNGDGLENEGCWAR